MIFSRVQLCPLNCNASSYITISTHHEPGTIHAYVLSHLILTNNEDAIIIIEETEV